MRTIVGPLEAYGPNAYGVFGKSPSTGLRSGIPVDKRYQFILSNNPPAGPGTGASVPGPVGLKVQNAKETGAEQVNR